MYSGLSTPCFRDDALVSHSPIPLPMAPHLNRLQATELEFEGHSRPPRCGSPDNVLEPAFHLYLFGSYQQIEVIDFSVDMELPSSNGPQRASASSRYFTRW